MITLGGSELARLNSNVRGVAWLIDLDFTTGTQRVTTAPVSIVESGNTYIALGGAAGVSALRESADGAAERISLSISVANSAMLALALGSVSTYRNKRATVSMVLFDENFQLVGNKIPRWIGYMDKVNIQRKGTGGTVEMICSRSGMPKARAKQGARLTDAQQQQRYPGDTGLRYIPSLVEKPALWLSKKFQEV